MVIRNYKSVDRDAIIGLLRANTPTYFSPTEEKDLLWFLDHDMQAYYVAEANQRLVGCGGYVIEDAAHGVICWDMVHPDFHGKGVGGSLLEHRLGRLKTHGLDTVTVRTSQLAHRFYEKHGFHLVEIVDNYWAPGFHLYRMEFSFG